MGWNEVLLRHCSGLVPLALIALEAIERASGETIFNLPMIYYGDFSRCTSAPWFFVFCFFF